VGPGAWQAVVQHSRLSAHEEQRLNGDVAVYAMLQFAIAPNNWYTWKDQILASTMDGV
jgi:hypothetical protein